MNLTRWSPWGYRPSSQLKSPSNHLHFSVLKRGILGHCQGTQNRNPGVHRPNSLLVMTIRDRRLELTMLSYRPIISLKVWPKSRQGWFSHFQEYLILGSFDFQGPHRGVGRGAQNFVRPQKPLWCAQNGQTWITEPFWVRFISYKHLNQPRKLGADDRQVRKSCYCTKYVSDPISTFTRCRNLIPLHIKEIESLWNTYKFLKSFL